MTLNLYFNNRHYLTKNNISPINQNYLKYLMKFLVKHNTIPHFFYSWIITVCACGLLVVWPLRDILFLRHLLLLLGSIASLPIIFSLLELKNLKAIPLIVLGTLFVWVLIHYVFFSLDRKIELYEIKGLWVRVLAAWILAIGLAISLKRFTNLRYFFYFATLSTSIINIAAYLHFSYLENNWIVEFSDRTKYYFAKIEPAFFGTISMAINCFLITNILKNKDKQNLKLGLILIGIAIIFISLIISRSKNGILFSVILAALFLSQHALEIVKKKKFQAKELIVLSLFLVTVFSGIFAYIKTSPAGWDNFVENVVISADIEKHRNWVNLGEPFPLNSAGETVSTNLYQRISYIMAGLFLIEKYPLGLGSINNSFWKLLDIEGIDHNYYGQTHQGWIDLTLAFGLPGLGIVWTCLVMVIFFGFRGTDESSKLAGWISVTIFLMGLTSEITYKEEFEAYMFFSMFSAACLVPLRSKKVTSVF